MNKIFIALAMTASIFGWGCASKTSKTNSDSTATEPSNTSKVLVAYFSATGNTKTVAEDIAGATGGELYEIAPVPRYTDEELNWRDKQSRSTIEMNDSTCRPDIGGATLDITGYDIVFVGYPIWWNLAPRQVNTFLEKYDFSGKTMIPFATSGETPIENSVEQLRKLYPQYDWRNGKLLNDRKEVAEWAKSQLK